MKTRNHLLTGASAALIGAVIGTSAVAQENSPFYLGELVLTATGLPTEVLNSPASVTVITAEELNREAPTSVAKMLNKVPGVRFTEAGIERIKIRGEDSQRVALLIDGQRLSDHNTYGTPVLISPSSIERIEIVRGSSSVISGNRAIGGVVNIITKRGADVPLEVVAEAGYFSATDGYRKSLSVAGSSGNLDYRLSYSQSNHGDQKSPIGDLENSDQNDRDLFVHLGYEMGNHYFGARIQDFDIDANTYTGDPENFIVELPKRDLRKYSAFYEGTDLTPWVKSLKLSAYHQTVDRLFANDITQDPIGIGSFVPAALLNVISTSDDEQTTKGFNASAELAFAPGHRTFVGVEYEHDRLTSDKLADVKPPFSPRTQTTRDSDATIRTASVYAQHEVELSPKLTATAGARYYKVDSDLDEYSINGADEPASSNDDSRFLGAVGLVWKPSEDTSYRFNISQGYTYPSLSELYLQTTAGGQNRLTIGNPGLEPETSTTFEIGARIDRDNLTLDTTLFYIDAENYITTQDTGDNDISGDDIYQYINVDRVETWGLEVAAEFAPQDRLWGARPYLTGTLLNRELSYENGVTTSQSGNPALTGSIGLRGDWETDLGNGTWDLYVYGETAAKLRDSDDNNEGGRLDDRSSAWATLNFAGTMNVSNNVKLSLGLNNILNAEYRPIDQVSPPDVDPDNPIVEGLAPGRNISLFLTATF